MILLDTGIVVDALRPRNVALRGRFAEVEAAICGITRAEVLQGARDPAGVEKLRLALDGYPQVPIPEDVWDLLGQHLAQLDAVGRRIPLADATIATVAIFYQIPLWARDDHYNTFQQFIPALTLFAEPAA